jgi:hypothetical protein
LSWKRWQCRSRVYSAYMCTDPSPRSLPTDPTRRPKARVSFLHADLCWMAPQPSFPPFAHELPPRPPWRDCCITNMDRVRVGDGDRMGHVICARDLLLLASNQGPSERLPDDSFPATATLSCCHPPAGRNPGGSGISHGDGLPACQCQVDRKDPGRRHRCWISRVWSRQRASRTQRGVGWPRTPGSRGSHRELTVTGDPNLMHVDHRWLFTLAHLWCCLVVRSVHHLQARAEGCTPAYEVECGRIARGGFHDGGDDNSLPCCGFIYRPKTICHGAEMVGISWF